MLKEFQEALKAGWQWLSEEMSRPMPNVAPKRSRRAPPPRTNNYDEDRHHHDHAYDGDAFSTNTSSGGDGDGD